MIKITRLEDFEELIKAEDRIVVLLDDIFGETNTTYNIDNKDRHNSVLDKIHAFVVKKNVKVVMTTRETVKKQCKEIFERHKLFQSYATIDLSSDAYDLTYEEKASILSNLFKLRRNADLQADIGYVTTDGSTVLMENERRKILSINYSKGFPQLAYQFVYNENYLRLGSRYFDSPTAETMKAIEDIRQHGYSDRTSQIKYAVLVSTVLNGNSADYSNNSQLKTSDVNNIIESIYGNQIHLLKIDIVNALESLMGIFLIRSPDQRSYYFQHQSLLESTLKAFAETDDEHLEKIIPVVSLSFFEKMMRSEEYVALEDEIVLHIPQNLLLPLRNRLVELCPFNLVHMKRFVRTILESELFITNEKIMLESLISACGRREWICQPIDEEEEEEERWLMPGIKIDRSILLNTTILECAPLLKRERQSDMLCIVLKQLSSLYPTKDYFSKNFIEQKFTSLIYEWCSSLGERVIATAIEIGQNFKMPISYASTVEMKGSKRLLYHGVSLHANIIYIKTCIVEAIFTFNKSVLEYFIKYINKGNTDIRLIFQNIDKSVYNDFKNCTRETLSALEWLLESGFISKKENLVRLACRQHFTDKVRYYYDDVFENRVNTFLHAFFSQRCYEHHVTENRTVNQCSDLFKFLLSKLKPDKSIINNITTQLFGYNNCKLLVCLLEIIDDQYLDLNKILELAFKGGEIDVVEILVDKVPFQDLENSFKYVYMDAINNLFTRSVEKGLSKIVQFLLRKFNHSLFDLKCISASLSKCFFKITLWLLQNVNHELLDIKVIFYNACKRGEKSIIEHILKKSDNKYFDKNDIIEHVTPPFSCGDDMFCYILELLWNNTTDKKSFDMQRVVDILYNKNYFKTFMWVLENCFDYINLDLRRIFLHCCKNLQVQIVKWLFDNVDNMSLNCTEGLTAAAKVHTGVQSHTFSRFMKVPSGNRKQFIELASYQHTKIKLSDVSITTIMNEALKNENFVCVEWLLDTFNLQHFDIKHVMKLACRYSSINIIQKILSHDQTTTMKTLLFKSCYDLFFNEDNSDISDYHSDLGALEDSDLDYYTFYFNDDGIIELIKFLWTNYRHVTECALLINKLFEKIIFLLDGEDVLWIVKHCNPFEFEVYFEKNILRYCQNKSWKLVKYILSSVNHTCSKVDLPSVFKVLCHESPDEDLSFNSPHPAVCFIHHIRTYVKDFDISMYSDGLVEALARNNYNVIHYFLYYGHYDSVNFNILMKNCLVHGRSEIVQWILRNVPNKVDLESVINEATSEISYKSLRRNLWWMDLEDEPHTYMDCYIVILLLIKDCCGTPRIESAVDKYMTKIRRIFENERVKRLYKIERQIKIPDHGYF